MPDSLTLPDSALWIEGKRIEGGTSRYVDDPWDGERLGSLVLANEVQADAPRSPQRLRSETTRRMPSYARRRLLEGDRLAPRGREGRSWATLIEHEAASRRRSRASRSIARSRRSGSGAEEATRIGGEVIPLDVTEATAGYRDTGSACRAGPCSRSRPSTFRSTSWRTRWRWRSPAGERLGKPPPQTPLTSLRLAEIVRRGRARRALQVVPCSNEVAETLVRHDAFSVLSRSRGATGSVGTSSRSRAAST